jgi:hypothetical protein
MKNVLIAVSMIPAAAISNATPAAAKQACNDRMIARGLAPDYAVEYMLEFLGLYTMQGRDQLENIAIGECKAEDNSRIGGQRSLPGQRSGVCRLYATSLSIII